MKMSFSHKPILMGGGILIIISILLVLFTTCDIGLGQIVNTEKPVINSAGDNPPGTFLQGKENKIALDVSNKLGFKIVEVWMDVDYIDAKTGQPASKRVDAQQDPDTGEWFVMLDTSDMEDGPIKGKVTAKDESGNTATTTEMVYNVKNTPPQIKLNMPLVEGQNWDDDEFLKNLAGADPLFLGFDLLGLATDDYGIEMGYPKIMIWPAPEQTFSILLDENGLPSSDPKYGEWNIERSLVVPNPKANNTTATKFSWPMRKLVSDSKGPGGYRLPQGEEKTPSLNQGKYRLYIVTKDLFGNENYYPNRTDTTRTPDKPSPKFIEISYIASAIPIIQVTEATQYYNGASDFLCEFLVSCSNPLNESSPVRVHITDGNEGNENELGGPYFLGTSSSVASPYKFKLSISPEQASLWKNKKEGIMYLRLFAIDKEGKDGPPAYQYFQYDITPPDVPIERPVPLTNTRKGDLTGKGGRYTVFYPDAEAPKWVTGTVTVGGRNDEANGIKEVLYHIGKLGDDADPASFWITNYSDSSIWTDTRLHTSSPETGWGGSVYSWSYTESFAKGYKTNNPGVFQELSELYNYNGDPDESITVGKERFYLPFYVKVVDYAKNFHIVHYKLCIDPDLDQPQVVINYPGLNGMNVGGEVRLSGTANDNNWVHSVQVRLKKYGSGTGYDKSDDKGNFKYVIPAGFLHVYTENPNFPTFNSNSSAAEKEGWFNPIKTGDDMFIGWYVNINSDGELDPDPEKGDTVDVRIEVRAVDTKDMIFHNAPDVVGPTVRRDVIFNTGVPTISIPKIKNESDAEPRQYFEGINSSRKFDITSIIGDDKGITRLRVWINGTRYDLILDSTLQNTQAAAEAGINLTPITSVASNRVEGTLKITIDTVENLLYKTRYAFGKTDYLNLEIEVQDDSNPVYTSRNSYIIGIDNYFPLTTIETFRDASGSQFPLSGLAKDYDASSGAIQDIARMLIYFEQATISYAGGRDIIGNGHYMNPRGLKIGFTDSFYSKSEYSSTGWTTIPDMTTNTNVRENGQGAGFPTTTFKNFPVLKEIDKGTKGKVWESPHAMVIDNPENGPDIDEDGTSGEAWFGLVDKTWQAWMDTTKFTDGPYVVHYIIMDKAGNATHYTNNIFIQNNKPVITSFNLGTDVDGNGTVADWTDETSPGEFRKNMTTVGPNHNGNVSYDPAFRIRGYNFRIMVNTTGGNNEKYGRLTYVTVKTGPKLPAASMERGVVYTIATTGTTDWERYGAPPNNSVGTTFIATGPGAGTGTVTEYNLGPSGRFNFGAGVNNYTNIHFTGAPSFNTATNGLTIDDSDKIAGVISNHNQRLFILKIFDTVVASGNETDMLAHAVLLAVDIDNSDDLAPKLDIAPFGQEYGLKEQGTNITWENDDAKELKTLSNNDYNKNIIMSGTERQGYVQYAYNSNGTINSAGTAYISGKVKFLGRAEDNQRIQNITVTIPGFNGGAAFTVASSPASGSTGGGQLTSARPPASMGTGNNAWYFNIIEQHLSLDYGHVLNWEFGWDSSEVTNQVGTPAIIFTINDHKPTTPNTLPKTINVNVVPYISDVVTGLSGAYTPSSAFARSANGWYPVRESEEITIKGFNLGAANYTGVRINTTNLTYDATTTGTIAAGNFRIVSKNEIKANVGTTATSGALSVRVGSNTDGNRTESINNTASIRKFLVGTNNTETNRVHYNWEPNGVNNDNLTNDRKLYVWNTGYVINDTVMLNPFMRMDSSSNRYVSFGRYVSYGGTNQGQLKVIVNNTGISATGAPQATGNGNANEGTVLYQTNRFINTTIGVSSDGDWATVASNITSGQSNLGLVYNQFGAGDGNNNGTTGNAATSMYRRIRNFGTDPYRAQIPRVAVQRTAAMPNNGRAAAARMVLSYYDATFTNTNDQNYPVIIHYGHNNGAGNPTWTGNIPNAAAANPATPTDGSVVATTTTGTAKSGMFTAVGLLSTGRPVIAWYDSITDGGCLWFSYGPEPVSNAITVTTTDWQTNARRVATGYGTHVDLTVDGSNNVHLAYVNASNGGLYYAFIPSATVTSANQNAFNSGIRTARVDTFLSTGQKLMINIRENRPYISYIHNAFAESKNSIRVAWSKIAITAVGNVLDGTNGNYFTGNWEVMTVPAESIPSVQEFVCNGVPANGTITRPSGSTLGQYYTNASTSIFITYMTNKWYEGAILKANIPSLSY